MTTLANAVHDLLLTMGDEEGSHYAKGLGLGPVSGSLTATVAEASAQGLITVTGKGDQMIVELTEDGRKVLAQHTTAPKKTPRKATNDTPNQEDQMSKDKKTKADKPAKKAKVKAEKTERTPNADSHRWVAIEAMKANPGATRDEIADICIKSNGGNAEVWSKRIARARRHAKRTGIDLGALGKPEKAEKPAKAKKAKAEKAAKPAKAKKAKKAADSDLLG